MRTAVFICTHGRPYKQYTLEALRKSGYTGRVILLLDDEDDTCEKYERRYKYDVDIAQFSKSKYIASVDYGTKLYRDVILYAKCACEDIARKMELDAFIISDDDTKQFRYRYVEDDKLKAQPITKNMDEIINSFYEYLLNADLTSLSFGYTSLYLKGIKVFTPEQLCSGRVSYNFVFRNTKHPVNWVGSYGEDLITACTSSIVGNVWLNLPHIQNDMIVQGESDGGMSGLYKNEGSFGLVQCESMYCPTSIKSMYYKNRFYGKVVRENTFPKIISSSFKKDKNVI